MFAETIIAAKNEEKEPLKMEICDLLYHLTVLMAQRGVSMDEVLIELDKRGQKIGNLKVMKKTDRNT